MVVRQLLRHGWIRHSRCRSLVVTRCIHHICINIYIGRLVMVQYSIRRDFLHRWNLIISRLVHVLPYFISLLGAVHSTLLHHGAQLRVRAFQCGNNLHGCGRFVKHQQCASDILVVNLIRGCVRACRGRMVQAVSWCKGFGCHIRRTCDSSLAGQLLSGLNAVIVFIDRELQLLIHDPCQPRIPYMRTIKLHRINNGDCCRKYLMYFHRFVCA